MTTAPSATEQPAPEPPARLHIPREQIAEFCRRWRIIEFSIFGSALREDFRPDSDVDVLVARRHILSRLERVYVAG
ncbi:MAG: nucleotidyltransferase domain-containing protein [Anaerolineales bacterium]|nr:nucleotidyltransferase domain-containing protein [Anaerolineales bacterium]